jgi:hypothetical protein
MIELYSALAFFIIINFAQILKTKYKLVWFDNCMRFLSLRFECKYIVPCPGYQKCELYESVTDQVTHFIKDVNVGGVVDLC